MTAFSSTQELLALAGDRLWQSTLFAAAAVGYSSWRVIEIVPYSEGPVLIEAVSQPRAGDSELANLSACR